MTMKQWVEKYHRQLEWSWLAEAAQQTIQQAIAIQQIPAPTFDERERAAYVAEQFAALGLTQIETDDFYNVYGLMPGSNSHRPGVLISAHTDTVFARETDLKTRVENGLIYGPGLGDNSMGVAGMLGLADSLRKLGIKPACDLWFVANTREEGLGDLGGMKAAFNQLKERIGSVINLEGMAFGHVYHAGIAVRRLHITARAEGGHSWLNFGRSSAIHGLIELGAKITALQPSQNPRTTYNIGVIDGGQSINTIAAEASFWLDMRSEQSSELAKFEAKVHQLIQASQRPDLQFQTEVVGDRPAGTIAQNHPLVQGALAALELVGTRGTLENGSTDANVPLAAGYPAVTVGITRGGNAHRLDEFIETQPIAAGLHQLVILTLAACTSQTL